VSKCQCLHEDSGLSAWLAMLRTRRTFGTISASTRAKPRHHPWYRRSIGQRCHALIGQCLVFLERVMSPHVASLRATIMDRRESDSFSCFDNFHGYSVCSLSSDVTDSSSHDRCAGFRHSTKYLRSGRLCKRCIDTR